MPGSAGGGHGGSVGGGSRGGSFGGGHSGSIGSRSSGSSGSRSSSGGRSYSGGYRPVYRSGGYYRTGGGNYSRSSNGGCFSGLLGAILIPVFVTVVLLFVLVGVFSNRLTTTHLSEEGYTGEIVSETVHKAKLAANLCTPLEDNVESLITEELDAAGEAKVEEAVAAFYSATGVQPYFLLMRDIGGDTSPDYDEVNDFLYEKYVNTFGGDEGHLIVLMLLDDDDYYNTWYIIGDDAVTVTDDSSCDVILTRIDEYFEENPDVADVVSKAFTVSADEIMSEVHYLYYDENGNEISENDAIYSTPVANGLSFGVVFLMFLGFVATVFFVVRALKKNKAAAAKPGAQTVAAPQQTPPVQQSPPQQTFKNQLVTCPHCGATAYPKTDGTCDYCGSRIV